MADQARAGESPREARLREAAEVLQGAFLREKAKADRMRSALERLAEWDMLHLGPDGRGTATADAPWARRLIHEAIHGEPTDG